MSTAVEHRIIPGDCIAGLRTLPDASVHCCVTSPPYWGLRDYGHDGQIGLESTPEAYVARMVEVFREVRRVLRDDGTCWINLGDSYASMKGAAHGSDRKDSKGGRGVGDGDGPRPLRPLDVRIPGLKQKDLVGIPWRVAFALQADGWWLRQDIIWHKPNPMPESVTDRCTKAHEYVFLFAKSERYFYDAEAVSEAAAYAGVVTNDFSSSALGLGIKPSGNAIPGTAYTVKPTRNRRSVWTITTKPYSGAHFAVMPPDLVEPCIKAGCPEQCCPACGAGWERVVERTASSWEERKACGHKSNRGGNSKIQLAAGASHDFDNKAGGFGTPSVSKTLGWQPACDCAASGTISGTVLDPFAGSGTTLAVAAELGRSGIGCELNPEYIELANQRIAKSREKVALFA